MNAPISMSSINAKAEFENQLTKLFDEINGTDEIDQDALIKLRKARTKIALKHPFYSTIILQQRTVQTRMVPTMGTTDEVLFFNPEFVLGTDHEELQGVLVHEALHVALGHPWRISDEHDRDIANMAMDHAINLAILAEGRLKLPKSRLADERFEGMSWEKIYEILYEEQDGASGGGSGDDDGEGGQGGSQMKDYGGTGSVLPGKPEMTEAERQQGMQKAGQRLAQAVNMSAGNVPGSLQRIIGDILEPKANWRDLLLRFCDDTARNVETWSPPNRRFVHMDLLLPVARSEQLPPILWVSDASGSMPDEALRQALGELQSIMHTIPFERIDVISHDTKVYDLGIELERDDDISEVAQKMQGRGGTSFAPVLDWINASAQDYACVVWFTDMGASDWDTVANKSVSMPVMFLDWAGHSYWQNQCTLRDAEVVELTL